MYAAVRIARSIDNNPITVLMLRSGKRNMVIPPVGYEFLTDERNKFLCDEQRNYLIDHKEVQQNG